MPYIFKSKRGLDESVVRDISRRKHEPAWMLEYRLRALKFFLQKPLPSWGGDLSKLDFDEIFYYLKPTKNIVSSWDKLPKEIKNTYDKIGIPEAEKKFLSGVSAQYECLTGSTSIFTDRGIVFLKDVVVGTNIFAFNEKTKHIDRQKVIGVSSKGKRQVYRLTSAGRTICCTANHPLYVLRYVKEKGKRRGTFFCEWEYVRNLSEGDYIAISKKSFSMGVPFIFPPVSLTKIYTGRNQTSVYSIRSNWLYTRRQKNLRIPKKSSTDLLWLFGLYIGDGYISISSKITKKEVLSIAIPSTEKVMRKKLTSVVHKSFGLVMGSQHDPYRVRIHATPIIILFSKLGFRGSAKTKSIPKWVFQLPLSQRLAFIGGYIDSDGYLRSNKKNCDIWITSVNKSLLEQTATLAISCGLHVAGIHIFRYSIKNKNGSNHGYRLQITGNVSDLVKYSQKVAKGLRTSSYYHTYGSHHKSPITKWISSDMGFAPIKEIVPVGEENVYDIEVAGYHNFIANGIIVHNSEVVYKSINKMLEKKGVLFMDMDSGLREHPELVQRYFGSLVPSTDNKFAALNGAAWSGGSFLYIPKGVRVELPLQAYFRINAANMGQFERTLIIADEGSFVHYLEGCTAPIYTTDSLHAAVVEIIVKKGARVRYTTVQNWSTNVYNLVTKRARAEEDSVMEFVDGNLGSKLTMKYPSVILAGRRARGELLSIAYAGPGQHQDAGGKMFHVAPETSSRIISKSISRGGGRTSYRGLVQVHPGAKGAKSKIVCDALLLDEASRSDTYPDMKIDERQAVVEHEATVSKIGDEQLFYITSRGISKEQAQSMIVNGFIEPIVKELPLEYAVEMNRLIELQMEGSVG